MADAVGERVFPNKFGTLKLPEGGFGCDLRSRWWIRPEGGNAVTVAACDVTEHPDETITVSGFINQGSWRL